ncbi:MAG TPA: SapC family protein [Steroidobacteraceae bacterium]
MTNIVLLNSQTHRSLCVHVEPSARYGDNQRFVQVVVAEIPHLVMQYPVLLSKAADTGAFFCGAMLGVDEGENLFLREGGHEGYRPLNLQRMPFYVSGAELGIDLDHPRIAQERGQALFTEQGEATPYLESIKSAFRDLKPGIEMTKAFIDTLMKLKLVEPIDIKLGFDDGSKRELAGLYTINQSVLRELPDASVLELFRRGYLQLIYLMIASLKQVPVLARKKNDRLLQASEALAGSR